MAERLDIALATHLGDDVAALTLGASVFYAPVSPPNDFVPDEAVFCILGGGAAPIAKNGQADVISQPECQIRVRGAKRDYTGGLDLARLVLASVNFAPLTDYIDVRAVESEPNFLGNDDQDSPEWSINVAAQVEEIL